MQYVFPVFGLIILAAFILRPVLRRLRGRKRVLAPPSGNQHHAEDWPGTGSGFGGHGDGGGGAGD